MTTSKTTAAKWRERNRERIRLNLIKWRPENPDRVRAINERRKLKLRTKPKTYEAAA